MYCFIFPCTALELMRFSLPMNRIFDTLFSCPQYLIPLFGDCICPDLSPLSSFSFSVSVYLHIHLTLHSLFLQPPFSPLT